MAGGLQCGTRLEHIGVFVQHGVQGVDQAAVAAVAGQCGGSELVRQAQSDRGVGVVGAVYHHHGRRTGLAGAVLSLRGQGQCRQQCQRKQQPAQRRR